MTIKPGEEWGRPAERPAGLVELADDLALGAFVDRHRRAAADLPPVRLRCGDLARTLGISTAGGDGPPSTGRLVPVDLGRVELDGATHWFAAHLLARRGWWRGRLLAVMNAEFLGAWDLARRGHPNDGRLDVVEVSASMTVHQRRQAHRRLPTGTHVPHPAIDERRVRTARWEFTRPMPVWLDGRAVGAARTLEVVIEPDALEVFV